MKVIGFDGLEIIPKKIVNIGWIWEFNEINWNVKVVIFWFYNKSDVIMKGE